MLKPEELPEREVDAAIQRLRGSIPEDSHNSGVECGMLFALRAAELEDIGWFIRFARDHGADGLHAGVVLKEERPELYARLASQGSGGKRVEFWFCVTDGVLAFWDHVKDQVKHRRTRSAGGQPRRKSLNMEYGDLGQLGTAIEERYREIEAWIAALEELPKEHVGNISRDPIAHLAGWVAGGIWIEAYQAASDTLEEGPDGEFIESEKSSRRYRETLQRVWDRQVAPWTRQLNLMHPRLQAAEEEQTTDE